MDLRITLRCIVDTQIKMLSGSKNLELRGKVGDTDIDLRVIRWQLNDVTGWHYIERVYRWERDQSLKNSSL